MVSMKGTELYHLKPEYVFKKLGYLPSNPIALPKPYFCVSLWPVAFIGFVIIIVCVVLFRG